MPALTPMPPSRRVDVRNTVTGGVPFPVSVALTSPSPVAPYHSGPTVTAQRDGSPCACTACEAPVASRTTVSHQLNRPRRDVDRPQRPVMRRRSFRLDRDRDKTAVTAVRHGDEAV